MSDFLANLVAQALSRAPGVQPLLPARYAAMPAIAGVGTLDRFRSAEDLPTSGPSEHFSGPEHAVLPPPLIPPGDYDATYRPFSLTRIQQLAAPWAISAEPAVVHVPSDEAAPSDIGRALDESHAVGSTAKSEAGQPGFSQAGAISPLGPGTAPTRQDAAHTPVDLAIASGSSASLAPTLPFVGQTPVVHGATEAHATGPAAEPRHAAAPAPTTADRSDLPVAGVNEPAAAGEGAVQPVGPPASPQAHQPPQAAAFTALVANSTHVPPRLDDRLPQMQQANASEQTSSQSPPESGAQTPPALANAADTLVQRTPAALGSALPPDELVVAPARAVPASDQIHRDGLAVELLGPRPAVTPASALTAPAEPGSGSAASPSEPLSASAVDPLSPALSGPEPVPAGRLTADAGKTLRLAVAAPASDLPAANVLATHAVQASLPGPAPLGTRGPSKPDRASDDGLQPVAGNAIQAPHGGPAADNLVPPVATEATTLAVSTGDIPPQAIARKTETAIADQPRPPASTAPGSRPSDVDEPALRQSSPPVEAAQRVAPADRAPQATTVAGTSAAMPQAASETLFVAPDLDLRRSTDVGASARGPAPVAGAGAAVDLEPSAAWVANPLGSVATHGQVQAGDAKPLAARRSTPPATPTYAREADAVEAGAARSGAATAEYAIVRPAIMASAEPKASLDGANRSNAKSEPAALPTIRVTIGRVEVRSSTPVQRPMPGPAPRPRPALSLDDYLKRPAKVRP